MTDESSVVARTPVRALQLAPAAAGFLLTGSLLLTPAHAYEFDLADGEVKGTLNTTISIGTKYDMEGYETPDSNEQLENDGDRSFDGGFVSKALKLTSELELKKDNYGMFVRGTAYYDHVLMNGDNKWADNNADDVAKGLYDETGTFPGWSDEVKDNQGKGAKLQSAYVFADWEFDSGQKLSLKLGNQVHNWGETVFYGGGLMDLNAYDMALATLPGSDGDLKLAQGMVMADLAFNDQVSLSAFAQYDWEGSILPGRGTFGSEEDIFVPGSDDAHYTLSTFKLDTNTLAALQPAGLTSSQTEILNALGVNYSSDFVKVADVSGSQDAKNSGQWGVKLNFKPDFLKDTEFALYYANYHSSLPFIQSKASSQAVVDGATRIGIDNATDGPIKDYLDAIYTATLAQTGGNTAAATAARTQIQGALTGLYMLSNGGYAQVVYPEDIRLWGASFNTKVFGYTQIKGELTYRENAPIWVDHPEDLLTKAIEGTANIGAGQDYSGSQADPSTMNTPNQWNDNFVRKPMWDASLAVIQPFGAVLGTDLMYVVGEAAFQQVSGLDDYDRYIAKGAEDWAGDDPEKDADDRLDRFSWGYNLMLGANWNDVMMPGLNLESTIRYTHDVSGNSHFTGRFEEGEKKLNLGLTGKYDQFVAKLSLQGDADNVLRKGTFIGSLGYTF
ncbi:DUF1302 domain-containing protein [Endozoicomonas arenosclerae]|uniref:DUF1302 domain-containing protein n=1 Tax=Endozoicomonas arenosclerae TaxID=1633495 RepID=UPI000783418C|nr:DUF1302 family protein [Endozoicomonas arenosclerae]